MKILENLNSKKISRKNFLFYSGIALAGLYAFLKLPFNLFGNKNEKEEISENNSNEIRFKINPNAVKRESRGGNG